MKRLLLLLAIPIMMACGKDDGESQSQLGTTKIEVVVNGTAFTATLYDNKTARAFADMLPLTLQMRELNGNEKYANLDGSLPTDEHRAGTIHTGDLKLYGDDCLVLFYETFSSSYRYSDIGKLDDASGLAKAVGNGNVTATFRLPVAPSSVRR